ncbi:hypothetical protein ACN47E_005356 [Coniothyrium glycines]
MEQSNAPNFAELEDQLRSMILGNVTIGSGQANQESHSTHRGRGRGRGRGGFSRGSDRGHHQAEHGPTWRSIAAADAASPRGRGRAQPQPQGQHYQEPRRHQQGQQASDRPQYDSLDVPSKQHVPRSPAQPRHQQSALGRQEPRVLQRKYDKILPQGQGPAAAMSYQHPRFNTRPQHQYPREDHVAQSEHLENIARQEVPKVEMSLSELDEKEAFRRQLEEHLRRAFMADHNGDISAISLVGFGSLASGFAMPGSDMDLAVVPQWNDPARVDEISIDRTIPRLLERAILDAKMGGRLLTRTRVPILKVCQSPPDTLFTALMEEREKWDALPEEEQYPSNLPQEIPTQLKALPGNEGQRSTGLIHHLESPSVGEQFPELGTVKPARSGSKPIAKSEPAVNNTSTPLSKPEEITQQVNNVSSKPEQQPRSEKQWKREKELGPLDFPKTGCGIQCDINFGNPLGIHNTHMLRCYSLTDPRVRPIVLFVKSWAKRRQINSSYSGTLSSYGWVLMVLHYLVNIAQPPVCPNLQHSIPQPSDLAALEKFFKDTTISGYNVRFWRNEEEIVRAAHSGQLTRNQQSVGELLRGFFQYFAGIPPGYNYGPRPPQFYWTNEVLSLRTPGGILSKQSKGWVSATTKITAEKKVTNRYLFAIEDPFEIDHNVARTVTHKGIVAIRDDFRRAWRILRAIGQGHEPEGGIFDEVVEVPSTPTTADGVKEEVAKGTMETSGGNAELAIGANGKQSAV